MCTNCKISIILPAKVDCTGPCFHHIKCRIKWSKRVFFSLPDQANTRLHSGRLTGKMSGPPFALISALNTQAYLNKRFGSGWKRWRRAVAAGLPAVTRGTSAELRWAWGSRDSWLAVTSLRVTRRPRHSQPVATAASWDGRGSRATVLTRRAPSSLR